MLYRQNFPEEIKAENKLSDPYFPYIKRPLVTDATAIFDKKDLPGILNRVPQDTRKKFAPYFIPWTFNNVWAGFNSSATELGKIIPDRIKDKTGNDYVDPNTGYKYVKLYHGSAAKYKDDFLKKGIAFDKGVRNAYGQGFYLTANINEAKRYACDAAGGGDAILLVVGVEDRPEVKGQRGAQSNFNTGESLDPQLKFWCRA